MINDARARRKTLAKKFSCEQCEFTSGSVTLIERHKNIEHKTPISQRNTYRSKRLNCEHCEQKFNKKETFNRHMKKFHGKENPTNELPIQNDPPTLTVNDEVQTRVTRLRYNKTLKCPGIPNN